MWLVTTTRVTTTAIDLSSAEMRVHQSMSIEIYRDAGWRDTITHAERGAISNTKYFAKCPLMHMYCTSKSTSNRCVSSPQSHNIMQSPS